MVHDSEVNVHYHVSTLEVLLPRDPRLTAESLTGSWNLSGTFSAELVVRRARRAESSWTSLSAPGTPPRSHDHDVAIHGTLRLLPVVGSQRLMQGLTAAKSRTRESSKGLVHRAGGPPPPSNGS